MTEREQFEVYAASVGWSGRLYRSVFSGNYAYGVLNDAWTVWQARAALSPSVGEKEGDAKRPVAFALRFPDDDRLNLSTIFDTRDEAERYVDRCSSRVSIVPLFASLSAHKGAEE